MKEWILRGPGSGREAFIQNEPKPHLSFSLSALRSLFLFWRCSWDQNMDSFQAAKVKMPPATMPVRTNADSKGSGAGVREEGPVRLAPWREGGTPILVGGRGNPCNPPPPTVNAVCVPESHALRASPAHPVSSPTPGVRRLQPHGPHHPCHLVPLRPQPHHGQVHRETAAPVQVHHHGEWAGG